MPASAAELELYRRHSEGREPSSASFASFAMDDLESLRAAVLRVFAEESVLAYAQRIAAETRRHPDVTHGASVRSVLQLIDAAKAHAFLEGRDFVVPADVATLAPSVLGHRLCLRGADPGSRQRKEIVREALDRVAAPK